MGKFSKKLSQNSGFLLLEVLIGAALLAGFLYFFWSSQENGRLAVGRQQQTVIANAFATELLEYFRSMDNTRIENYFATHPFGGSTPYPLCAHINIYDRQNANLVNEDPIALLPPSRLDSSFGPSNRYFKLSVVNHTTLQTVDVACGRSANNYTLGPDESYFLFVGVTWIAHNNNVQRAILSSVIGK